MEPQDPKSVLSNTFYQLQPETGRVDTEPEQSKNPKARDKSEKI